MNLDNKNSFEDAMNFHGLASREPVINNGKIQRFSVKGDKSGTKNGWYILYEEVGVYGSWKTGEKFTWYSKNAKMPRAVGIHVKKQLDQILAIIKLQNIKNISKSRKHLKKNGLHHH